MLRITWNDGNVTHHPDSETGNWQIEMKIRNGVIAKVEKTVESMTIRELSQTKGQYLDITELIKERKNNG